MSLTLFSLISRERDYRQNKRNVSQKKDYQDEYQYKNMIMHANGHH